MPQTEMVDETPLGPDDAAATSVPALSVAIDPLDALSAAGQLGSKAQIEAELDMIAASIRSFHRMHPDQVLRYCSGFSARLTEMCVLLHRIEGTNRQYTRVRTQQVQRYLEELERQWKTASRLIEVSRQDLQLLGKDT